MFRLMDDRKKRIQVSKQFFDEFLKLMKHYDLVDEATKKIWKYSMNPEEFRNEPKSTPFEEREQKIAELKRKKLIEATIEKLKDSEEDKDVREFWLSMINMSIMKAASAFKSIDLEFQLLAYRDSLPEEARKPSEPPTGPKKPLQTFHIPKGALDGMSYMFGDNSAVSEAQNEMPVTSNFGSGVVKTYEQTGQRVAVDTSGATLQDRMSIRQQYQAQVFQPHWNQPTMSLEEFADREMADAMEREQRQKEAQEAEDSKDPETREEEERLKQIEWDKYCDAVPKGYGNTKRL